MAEEVKIVGLKELSVALKSLPERLDRKVLNAALMAGARLIETEAKKNAPVLQSPSETTDRIRKAGTLKNNIRSRPGRPISGMTATVIVGVRKLSSKQIKAFKVAQGKRGEKISDAANPDDPFYWRFMEFGYTDRGGKFHPGRRFLRNAFEKQKRATVDVIKAALGRRIELEAAKLRRRK